MSILSRVLAVGALLALTGCGTLTAEWNLARELSGGNTFSECLAREYQDRATSEAYVDCNWVDTARIVRKQRAAESGAAVMPYDPANFGVLPGDLPELQDARARLMGALDRGGRTGDRACACAKAQRYYDGWVEQASDNKLGVGGSYFGGYGGPVQPNRVEAEKAAFYETLTECEGGRPAPVAGVGPWTIYFGFDRFDLTPEAQEVVAEIASSVDAPLQAVGHTDTSGTAAYNQALGQRRANAVANGLRANGAEVCRAVTRGESELAVATGDGVREPLNRRAEVSVCQ